VFADDLFAEAEAFFDEAAPDDGAEPDAAFDADDEPQPASDATIITDIKTAANFFITIPPVYHFIKLVD
jgi:hypothetical protein